MERRTRPRPSSFAKFYFEFGQQSIIDWNPVRSGTSAEVQLLAAQLQHTYAVVIRNAAIAKYRSLKKYADAAGVDYQRTTKILRGDAVMRLEDIATAHHYLNLKIPLPSKEAIRWL